ncbi:2'-5' RNA ligase family protein [Microbacterium sp.]|uniref:2'-5' RNA ligase family protein n=1 Tax=Microbacterium sp. TaxID=51671 RepID=UPI003566ED90
MREPEPRRSPSSIELLLDPAADVAIRAEWEALAARGLSSLAAHTSASNRPHITLVARIGLPAVEAEVFEDLPAFPVTLGAPLLFGIGARRVLARSVVPTAELLALRTAVHDALGPGTDAPHTATGEWMPHVALARRLRVADLAEALELVGGDIQGHARGVRRWDPEPASITTLATLRAP